MKNQLERRPCYYDGKRAMFHCWTEYKTVLEPSMLVGGGNGGQVSILYGLIEFEDGHCECVRPGNITFADGGGFDDEVFFPPQKTEEA